MKRKAELLRGIIPVMTIEGRKHNTDVIRVLYVNLESSIAGAEQSFLLFIRLAPKAVQISTACPGGILADKLSELGIRTYRISSAPMKLNFLLIWLLYLAIVNLQLILIVIKTRPQIIHANSSKAVLAVAMVKAMTGKKLIWHVRDLRCSRLLLKLCSSLSSKVIAVSASVKDKLVGLGVKAEFIEVIYNGVDVDDIMAEIKKKDQNISITFANVGQFVPWKKQLFFIEAAERFLQDNPKAQFILVGDDIFGRDSRYKKKLINKVKASPFVSGIKIISWQDDMELYWSQIDCLVHTADTEPFGRVVIEAMVHGIPVIAASGCGPAEVITNGKTGFLFAPDDIEELLKAMKTISQDRGLAHDLAINARQHVVSNFQARKVAERISRIYKKLMVA